jgi:hypothetical protein
VLENNHVGQHAEFKRDDIGTEAAREAVETSVAKRVNDVIITRPRDPSVRSFMCAGSNQ